MTPSQLKKINELTGTGCKVLGPTSRRPGSPTLMLGTDGKRYLVGGSGKVQVAAAEITVVTVASTKPKNT